MNGYPVTQQALVLSPHPDDESLGCGGTLKLISTSGGIFDVLYMTRGERGFFPGMDASDEARLELSRVRGEEAMRACRILGAHEVMFAEGRDGALGQQPQLAETILALLQSRPYLSVFCPWPHDGHADHAATYLLLHRALQALGREIDIWLYEVWTPLTPNMCIAIDQTMDAKMEAFAQHKSQAALLNYAEAFRGLAMYRGLNRPPSRFAEAFYTCSSGSLLRHEGLPWAAPCQRGGVNVHQ